MRLAIWIWNQHGCAHINIKLRWKWKLVWSRKNKRLADRDLPQPLAWVGLISGSATCTGENCKKGTLEGQNLLGWTEQFAAAETGKQVNIHLSSAKIGLARLRGMYENVMGTRWLTAPSAVFSAKLWRMTQGKLFQNTHFEVVIDGASYHCINCHEENKVLQVKIFALDLYT